MIIYIYNKEIFRKAIQNKDAQNDAFNNMQLGSKEGDKGSG